MQQIAESLVRCNPIRGLAEDLVEAIAAVHKLPIKQEVIANASTDALNKNEWTHFWKYSEAMSPHATSNAGYVPVGTPIPVSSLRSSLY